jgi:hypothetical protein
VWFVLRMVGIEALPEFVQRAHRGRLQVRRISSSSVDCWASDSSVSRGGIHTETAAASRQ